MFNFIILQLLTGWWNIDAVVAGVVGRVSDGQVAARHRQKTVRWGDRAMLAWQLSSTNEALHSKAKQKNSWEKHRKTAEVKLVILYNHKYYFFHILSQLQTTYSRINYKTKWYGAKKMPTDMRTLYARWMSVAAISRISRFKSRYLLYVSCILPRSEPWTICKSTKKKKKERKIIENINLKNIYYYLRGSIVKS